MNKDTLPLDSLEPIGPEQPNGVAPLLTRKDRKDLVPPAVAEQIVADDGLQVVEIDGLRPFRFVSAHFEAQSRISYSAAARKPKPSSQPCRRYHFNWTPQPAGATPRCRNPDPVTRLEPVDPPAGDRSTRVRSLEGVGS